VSNVVVVNKQNMSRLSLSIERFKTSSSSFHNKATKILLLAIMISIVKTTNIKHKKEAINYFSFMGGIAISLSKKNYYFYFVKHEVQMIITFLNHHIG
jgi:uncharacterized membrane protein YdcZ (DUF606 family)